MDNVQHLYSLLEQITSFTALINGLHADDVLQLEYALLEAVLGQLHQVFLKRSLLLLVAVVDQ